MFRKRAIQEPRAVNLTDSLGPHDKRIAAVVVVRAVRMLQRHPAAVDNVPCPATADILAVVDFPVKLDDPMPGIPGLPLEVDCRPVVNDSAIQRPGPGKFRIITDVVRGILLSLARGLVAFLSIAVAVEPVTTAGATIATQMDKAWHQ